MKITTTYCDICGKELKPFTGGYAPTNLHPITLTTYEVEYPSKVKENTIKAEEACEQCHAAVHIGMQDLLESLKNKH